MTSTTSTISECAAANVPPSWADVWRTAAEELDHISTVLERYERKHNVSYPLRRDIFNTYHNTALTDIRVVFVYNAPVNGIGGTGAPISNGMALSVHRDAPIPKTTQNLYDVLRAQYPNWRAPMHGDLTQWARAGVLLLQVSNTIDPEMPDSHNELWSGFTVKVLESIMTVRKNVPFVLFGKDCNRISSYINGSCPTYAVGSTWHMNDDLRDVFLKIDEYLIKNGGAAMNWTLDD